MTRLIYINKKNVITKYSPSNGTPFTFECTSLNEYLQKYYLLITQLNLKTMYTIYTYSIIFILKKKNKD